MSMLENNVVLNEITKFDDNMQVQYLLKNNTLLKAKQDISSVEEHIITYTLAKAQKQLIKMFDKKNRVYNTSEFPAEIGVTISNDEIKSICDNRQYYGKSGLKKLCNSLGSIRMNFVSYIDGYYTNTALIKSFKWHEDNPDEIIISIDKEVYLFLIDYTLNLKGKNIIIDEIKTPTGLKKKAEEKDTKTDNIIENSIFNIKEKNEYTKGYSRIELSFYKDIKNVYARSIFFDLKAAIENNKVYNSSVNTIEKTYTIEYLKEKFMLGSKYARFTDFNSRVLKTTKAKINESGYMIVDYSLQTKKAKGGNKVVAVTFKATMTDKLLALDGKYKIIPKTEEDTPKTLGEVFSARIREEGRLNVGAKTFNDFIDAYDENIVKRAVIALLTANEKQRIKAPKKWLIKTLEDMQTRENGYVIQERFPNGINPMKFNNFEPRDYDYDKLEKKLLGWDDSDKNSDEYYSDIYNKIANKVKEEE